MNPVLPIDTSAVKVTCFDAVGTLIYPQPPAAEIYGRVGRRCGAVIDEAEIDRRFRAAFRSEDKKDQQRNYQTSEERERRRWEAIVAEVFRDQPRPVGPLNELWGHFARPHAWGVYPDVSRTLDQLEARRIRLGIASNYDSRLRSVLAGLPALRRCELVAISAEIGWRKPSPQFFAALCCSAGVSAKEILLVGDDWDNDYQGGREAGLQVLLLDRTGRYPGLPAIRSLRELFDPHP